MWKHRISLEWSNPDFSRNLRDAIDLRSFCKLAKIKLSKEAVGTDLCGALFIVVVDNILKASLLIGVF